MRLSRYRLGERPSADWRVVVVGFVLCAGLIILFTVSSFIWLSAEAPGANTSPTISSVLSMDQVSRVINYYDGQRAQFNSIVGSPVRLVDPSK